MASFFRVGTVHSRQQHFGRPMSACSSLAKEIAPTRKGQKLIEKKVKLISSDVDGTLLNSKQELTVEAVEAIRTAANAGISTILATGKAPGPWVEDVLPRMPEKMPTVFLQGLLVWDANRQVIYERGLSNSVLKRCIDFASEKGIALAVYCGNRVLCEERGDQVDRLIFYKEPTPEPVGPLASIIGQITVHKVIYLTPPEDVSVLRPVLADLIGDEGSITTALPGMLEVLPPGASKGSSVARVLDHLGVAPDNLMAIGDGENDIEMLQLSGVAVAMGNAGQNVKDSADFVVSTNDENGFAEALAMLAL